MRESSSAATGTPRATGRVRLARTADLRGAGPHAASAMGLDLVALRTPAGWRVFQGRCPHQGALLGEGELDGETLVCRNHRWRFGVENGERQGGSQCLTAYPAFESGGELFVEVGAPFHDEPKQAGGGLRRVSDLPGPGGLPLLGNFLQLDLARLHEILEGWAERYGPLYRYRMGPRSVVVVSDPHLSQQVLRQRPETFRRLSNVEPVFAEMGIAGVFSAEGDAWRAQRRLAMEALSHRHLKGFYPTLRRVGERLLERWHRAAEAGSPIEIVDDLKRFTVDVTTFLTFGHDIDTLGQGDEVIQRRLEQVFPALNGGCSPFFPPGDSFAHGPTTGWTAPWPSCVPG